MTPPVEDALRRAPYIFDFFQAVRLLHRLRADRQVVGGDALAGKEVVRFASHATAEFPASDIHSLDWRAETALMTVNFMGLIGPAGVLPRAFTSLVCDLEHDVQRAKTPPGRSRMPPLQQFLSIFDHRMISLYYRVWEKYRAGLATERSGRELVSLALLASIGLASPGLQDRLKDVPDRALCYYAGLLSQRPRAAATLEQLLADYFDVPVTVQPFAGVWRRLEPTVQCCLDGTETPSHQAGRGAVVGDEFWDQSSMVRVAIGPLSLDQYVRFLPQGDAYPALRSLTRLFGGDEFEFEVQLILRRRQIPLCRIGDSGKAGPRLGWLTWMPEGKRDGEVGDTLLRL